MVAHQAEGMDLPIGPGARLAQGFEEPFPIAFIPEDEFMPVFAIYHVVNRPFIFSAQRSRHRGRLPAFLVPARTFSVVALEAFPAMLPIVLCSSKNEVRSLLKSGGLPPPIGAWCWRPKKQILLRLQRRWRSSVALTGRRCMPSFVARATTKRTPRT